MKVALATSLHLDHGGMSLDARPGDSLPMQAFVPLGLLSLKAYADRALGGGAEITVRELNTLINAGEIPNDDRFYDNLTEVLLSAGDDLVGLMTDADSLHHSVAIAERIKRRSPRTHVCIGGPTTSPMKSRFLERFPAFDSLVVGEGEATFAELLAALRDGRQPAGVAGLSWRDGDTVHDNPHRPLIEDLDHLPLPDFEAYPDTGTAALYLDVGRGCPFVCQFCATAPFWERRFRMKSARRIIAEMRLLRDRYGRDHVNYSHDIFTANRKWTLEFCAAMRAADLGMTWSCSTRTDVIDAEMLEAMAAAGCDEIYYGIEGGSPEIQTRIRKNLDLDRSCEIVRATAAAGIRPVTGFIVGYPFETEATLSGTLERFFEYLAVGGFRAHLFTLAPFHESPMFAEYAATVEAPAEYHDLPLSPGTAAEAAAVIARHRDVFASLFRYASPGIDPALVAATEELSAQLVLLRRLWPALLPHYASPLDWYRRWVAWIEPHNRRRRPGTRLVHQGDARDLLQFLNEELVRLELQGTPLASLLRYESMKQSAAAELPPGELVPSPLAEVSAETVVARACSYVAAPFAHDLRPVLTGGIPVDEAPPSAEPVFVIFAKTGDGALHTLHANPLACRLLELAATPRPLDALVDAALADDLAAEAAQYEACRRIVDEFVGWNLLSKVGA